jgi:hypothetical protein
MVQVRAPKELMTAIGDAIKRLDVQPPVVPNIELTAYIVVAVDAPDPKLMPLPDSLIGLGKQLTNILPAGTTLALADTVVARGREGTGLSSQGRTYMRARPTIRDVAGTTVVHLEEALVTPNYGVTFSSNVDIPLNGQVVVGRATPGGGQPPGPLVKAVILVMTAKVESPAK